MPGKYLERVTKPTEKKCQGMRRLGYLEGGILMLIIKIYSIMRSFSSD